MLLVQQSGSWEAGLLCSDAAAALACACTASSYLGFAESLDGLTSSRTAISTLSGAGENYCSFGIFYSANSFAPHVGWEPAEVSIDPSGRLMLALHRRCSDEPGGALVVHDIEECKWAYNAVETSLKSAAVWAPSDDAVFAAFSRPSEGASRVLLMSHKAEVRISAMPLLVWTAFSLLAMYSGSCTAPAAVSRRSTSPLVLRCRCGAQIPVRLYSLCWISCCWQAALRDSYLL